jgi:stage IV sporulation protein FB
MTRDPLTWAVPLFRAFGIQVRLHLLYILMTIGLIWRAWSESPDHWLDIVLVGVVLLFVCILLHEFGHCFAARRVGGDADEILMWPLGGLAYVRVPETPRANFIATAGGPAVNLVLFLGAGAVLLAASFVPPLNPFRFANLIDPELYNFSDGKNYIGRGDIYHRWVNRDKLQERMEGPIGQTTDGGVVILKQEKRGFIPTAVPVVHAQVDRMPDWALWTARFFWLNWFLFLINVLIPAFPLDGGRLFQCFIWSRSDYRNGTTIACYAGYGVAALLFIISLWSTDPMLGFMCIFIFFSCYRQLMMLEIGEGESFMGYDFSQGYTSLEKDNPPPHKPKKPGVIKRWLAARRAKRLQREAEQRAADEARLDELLDKVHRLGKESLSDEERRFMDRVSARYRNRS